MLTRTEPAKSHMLFRIPFGCVVTWDKYASDYPEIKNSLDGSDSTSTLLFYYSLNPLNNIYEFESEDAENDIAELIGIALAVVANGESEADERSRKAELEPEPQKFTEEEKQKQQRELFAFLHIEDSKERELFLESTLTIDEFITYSAESSTQSVPNENNKRSMKASKKERRRQKVLARNQENPESNDQQENSEISLLIRK